MKTLSTVLFHISFRGNLEGVWEPKLPDGDYIGKKPTKYSEPDDINRISVSSSIDGCLKAIFPNVDKLFEKYPSLDFFVYAATFNANSKCRLVTPEELTDKRYVHDAHVTQEHWLLDPYPMRLYERITVKALLEEKWTQYKPFNDPHEKLKDLAPPFEVIDRVVINKSVLKSNHTVKLKTNLSNKW